jgi:acyl dehydratase
MSAEESLFSEDFDALPAGASFVTSARTVTESDLASFSALTGDWHPQHADAEWAARSDFGGRVAHGMLVLSYAVGLVPIDPERVVALRGIDGVAFKRPVRIGDTIRVEGRLEETKPLSDQLGLARFSWRIVNQRDELAVRARITVLWRRGTPAPEASNGRTEEVYL